MLHLFRHSTCFFFGLLLLLSVTFIAPTVSAADKTSAVSVNEADGEYSIEVSLVGGSGKASVNTPTLMLVRDGKAYAKLTWSSSNYDYMIVNDTRYDNLSEEGAPSTFEIPILLMDKDFSVIADTTAMGNPHEIEYTIHFYSDSFGPKSELPQEAAKRVVWVALAIIIIGGVLNHFVKKHYYE